MLPASHRWPWWRYRPDQMMRFCTLLLWVVAGLALLAGLPEPARQFPWRLGWCSNRLLCFAVGIELDGALVMLLCESARSARHPIETATGPSQR